MRRKITKAKVETLSALVTPKLTPTDRNFQKYQNKKAQAGFTLYPWRVGANK